MEKLLTFERLLGKFEIAVALTGLVIVVVSTGIAVISRNVFNSPVIWTGELGILGQVWLTFFGASAVYKERGHVGMAGLADILPWPLSTIATILRDAVLAVRLIVVAVSLSRLMSNQGAQTLSTLGLPRALTSLPVAWCMFSTSASAFLSIVVYARQIRAGAAN